MAEQRDGSDGHEGTRYYRHDEAFWREMVAQWNNSWLSIRAFCRQHGLAVRSLSDFLCVEVMRRYRKKRPYDRNKKHDQEEQEIKRAEAVSG
ncbi:IS66 family insertion sequence element accessory protein TnpA [Cupriavidus necator]|uniref:IS66 family insertion sequence element accessory protein TnpA n=1 Tax=Cupriavidus necator TaxID=106590 RepID=UPI0009B6DEF7|nr:hypothetical protein [Cupriavidus necator]MDX6008074.1 hypothetical protein [Cupriavidus necator]